MAMTMPLTTAAQSRKTDWGTTPAPQKKDTVKVVKGTAEAIKDTVKAVKDAETVISTKGLTTPDTAQTVQAETPLTLTPDTLTQKKKRDWSTWRPETKRAMWLALVLPGAGQIYNRKYWKLPIIYGGFVGCAYALRWNNMMYKDYSQAYMDLMDNDPNTQSYNKFLYLGNQIDNSNKEYYQKLFKNRKDRYRKWRDMSVFAMVGVYLISVVDAYVDASLSAQLVGSGAAVLADILNYLWEDKRQTRKDILLYNEENICDYDRFGPVWMEYYPSPKRGN